MNLPANYFCELAVGGSPIFLVTIKILRCRLFVICYPGKASINIGKV